MTKSKRKKLYKLLKLETRCEIIARHGKFSDFKVWGQAAFDQLKYKSKIRKLMFGTSDLVELGKRWKMKI